MKTIKYFFRPQSQNVSIERVFKTVVTNLPHEYSYDSLILPNYLNEAKGIFGLLKAFIKIRSFCKKNGGEINHITGDIHYCVLFLPRHNTILTIHDLVSLKKLTGYKRSYVNLLWYYLPLRFAKNVTCISQNTADEIINLFPWTHNKLTVIPNPIGLEFKYKPKLFNTKLPTILHIGTRENKNLNRVIEALKNINCHLRIIGKLTNEHLKLLTTYKLYYTNENFISNEQIVTEYENCDIVSFPSTYEGFGMPIIEGQMVGRIVLTSFIPPMREISGGGAFLVDPFSVNSIKNGFLTILSDVKCRESILESSKANISKFDPSIIAMEYCKLYRKL